MQVLNRVGYVSCRQAVSTTTWACISAGKVSCLSGSGCQEFPLTQRKIPQVSMLLHGLALGQHI